MSDATNVAAIVTTIVTGTVTITTLVIGFLTLWVKLKYGVAKAEEAATKALVVEGKIDDNTKITKTSAAAAVNNARLAADTASEAKAAATYLVDQLNGKLEDKITSIVKAHVEPIMVVIKSHTEQDDKNMQEIRRALDELRDRTSK